MKRTATILGFVLTIAALLCGAATAAGSSAKTAGDGKEINNYAAKVCDIAKTDARKLLAGEFNFEFFIKSQISESFLKEMSLSVPEATGLVKMNVLGLLNISNELPNYDSCVVTGSRAVDCSELYSLIEASTTIGSEYKVTTEKVAALGKKMGLKSCGFFSLSMKNPSPAAATPNSPAIPPGLTVEFATGKIGRNWKILGFIPQRTYAAEADSQRFTACSQEMEKVKYALELQIAQEGSLAKVSTVDDVCKDVVAGAGKSASCKGVAQKQLDSACAQGSFEMKITGPTAYEMTAKSRGETDCCICMTRDTLTPGDFSACKKGAACDCGPPTTTSEGPYEESEPALPEPPIAEPAEPAPAEESAIEPDAAFNRLDEAAFLACRDTMTAASLGLDLFAQSKGSLTGVSSVDDVCNLVIRGSKDTASCKGIIEKRAAEYCAPGSFEAKIMDAKTYELKAKSADAKSCCICVTESGVLPYDFSECNANGACQCSHGGEGKNSGESPEGATPADVNWLPAGPDSKDPALLVLASDLCDMNKAIDIITGRPYLEFNMRTSMGPDASQEQVDKSIDMTTDVLEQQKDSFREMIKQNPVVSCTNIAREAPCDDLYKVIETTPTLNISFDSMKSAATAMKIESCGIIATSMKLKDGETPNTDMLAGKVNGEWKIFMIK